MTAPAQQMYGYAHRGTITGPSEVEGYWRVRCTAINSMRPIGPYASTVPDLAVGDRVLLTQIGTTRDDLVITGKLPAVPWDAHLPIGIDDVTGLQAALDTKAAAADLTDFETGTNLNFLLVNSKNEEQDGRLDTLEAADVTLDGRLDTAEANITTNTAGISANTSSIGQLNLWSWRNQDHDRDVYGDLVDFGAPRWVFSSTRAAGGAVGLISRTRVRRDVSVSTARVYVTTGGVGGSGFTTAAIYTATSGVGTYNLVASGSTPLTGTGRQNISIPPVLLTAGTYVLVLLTSNGYTSAPVFAGSGISAHNTLLNPSGVIVWATKSGVSSAPATIDPQDGTWSAQQAPWWVALS